MAQQHEARASVSESIRQAESIRQQHEARASVGAAAFALGRAGSSPDASGGESDSVAKMLGELTSAVRELSAKVATEQQSTRNVLIAGLAPEVARACGFVLPDENSGVSYDNSNYRCLTAKYEQALEKLFETCDTDESGELSQTEVIRLLQSTDLFTNNIDARELIETMDEDDSGSIEMPEFMHGMDMLFSKMSPAKREEFFARQMKVGFGGTRWRSRGSLAFLSSEFLCIISIGVLFAGVIHFSFILVPLVMAYFGTFVLGPLVRCRPRPPLLAGLPAFANFISYFFDNATARISNSSAERPRAKQ